MYQFNERSFDILNPQSCYWVGMLMADGHVVDRGKCGWRITLSLMSSDKGHVASFKDFLKAEHPVRIYTQRGYGGAGESVMARLSVQSRHMAMRLAELGVVPNKSKTARAHPFLASSPDFWRGVIDGDGSLGLAESGLPRIQLYGSEALMGQFKNFVAEYSPGGWAKVGRCRSIFSFKVSGRFCVPLLRTLYYDGCVALPRKRELAMEWKKLG